MKYIVYLTTNLVNKKIYIGVHKTENPYKFDGYIGCGACVNDKHSWMFGKYPLHAAIRKYGVKSFTRKTLKVFDKLQDALDLEAWLVDKDFINRPDTYNATIGGGVPPAPDKTIYQYSLDGTYIREWKSITEASIYYKCSSSAIGRAVLDNTPSVGYLWQDYKLDKLNISDFKINANKIPCYLYNLDGTFNKEFKSITECSEYLNRKIADVSRNCKTGSVLDKKYYVSTHKYDLFPIPENNLERPVFQYGVDGKFIKRYENVREARKALNITAHIPTSIRANTLCGGYQWSWKYVKEMPSKKPKARKVGRYSLEGELLETYSSIRKAKEFCSGSTNALYGRQKQSCGYIWKFID